MEKMLLNCMICSISKNISLMSNGITYIVDMIYGQISGLGASGKGWGGDGSHTQAHTSFMEFTMLGSISFLFSLFFFIFCLWTWEVTGVGCYSYFHLKNSNVFSECFCSRVHHVSVYTNLLLCSRLGMHSSEIHFKVLFAYPMELITMLQLLKSQIDHVKPNSWLNQ